MDSYKDALEIDIKDLSSKILRKWKLILISAIIFALLAIGYGLATGSQLPSAYSEPKKITLDDLKEELKGKLTSKEARDVELAYNAYIECEKLYDEIDTPETGVELVKATQQVLEIKKSFTPDQQLYYTALFEGEGGTVSKPFSGKINADFSAGSGQNEVSVKLIVLAALAGAALVIIITATKYILSPVLKTEDDLRNAFKLPIISSFHPGDADALEYVYNSMYACAKKADVQKVCILGSAIDANTAEYKQEVSDMFPRKDMSVRTSDYMLDDPDVLDSIVNSDGVILFERIGHSKYEDIAKEIERCNNFGVKILGAVVVE
ncbi:MAG: hypothetical protein J5802_14895 [Butyrivibrio sp.]|nr:hypothetical protein [Butyrivibrio sp.]